MHDLSTPEAAQSVIVSKAEMMLYHDPERIRSYCLSCEKYGLYWSCPPFEKPPFAELPEWTHALLVTQKTCVDAGATPEALIDLFLASRQVLGDILMQSEQGGALSLVAGHCFGCSRCTRAKGVACCAPERLRFSLEALGFDVTGLAKGWRVRPCIGRQVGPRIICCSWARFCALVSI